MINFPHAKINLGLHILKKRPDGFHEINTAFYPVPLCDVLEIMPSPDNVFRLNISGIDPSTDMEENLCVRAFRLLEQDFPLAPVHIHLHKAIPAGAGLGGGSSDAAFTLKQMNMLFSLEISDERMMGYAARLGSDCAFFVQNQPAFAQGRGEILEQLPLSLKGKFVVIVKPDFAIATAYAYSLVKVSGGHADLKSTLQQSCKKWKRTLGNDFENALFPQFPLLADIKDQLYRSGALYASLSGSGSAMYGIFDELPDGLKEQFSDCFVWAGRC